MSFSNNLVSDFKSAKWLENSKPITWDNIHWWGGYKKFHIPSTPGAFHAAHLHWRWGLNLQEKPKFIDSDPKYSGSEQFVGAFLGGALVDPKIFRQNIKFAIIKNELMPANFSEHSSVPFEKVFKENKGNIPLNIKKGTDLVLYLSCEAIGSKAKFKFNGTFFIHGLFFAHDQELPYFENLVTFETGSKESEYLPSEPEMPYEWHRLPSDLK